MIMTTEQMRDWFYDNYAFGYVIDGRDVYLVKKRGTNEIVIMFYTGPDKVISF